MIDFRELGGDLVGGGLPMAVLAATVVVAFLVGFVAPGGGLLVMALGVLAALVVDVAVARPAADADRREPTAG